jgi:hypothetical protein
VGFLDSLALQILLKGLFLSEYIAEREREIYDKITIVDIVTGGLK